MENKEKEGLSKKTIIITSLVFVIINAFLFYLQNKKEKLPKEIYLVEKYQKQSKLFENWSNLNGNYELDKDTILYSNIEEFEALYEFELQSIFEEELSMVKYKGKRYSKTYDQIDRKLDIFFEVQGKLYFDYGFEFSPGGGYFYLPKSKSITDEEYKNLQQKLALLENFEKFWRTRK